MTPPTCLVGVLWSQNAAVTAETRVGATTASVRVSPPVMLRLATPRQVVVGDRLTLVGTVHNRTEAEREFVVEYTRRHPAQTRLGQLEIHVTLRSG